jgi:hypothetical protein
MFNYITTVSCNGAVLDRLTTQSLSSARAWADRNTMTGDLVVISEVLCGIDGAVDEVDHTLSYYIDE